MHGLTGSRKSALAAIALAFYGDFTARSFPAKVFPYAVWLRLNKKLFKNPSLLIKKENNKITLSGVCSYQNLNELKKLLKEEISNNQTNFIFDLENVQAIDNAFLGLLILLRKYSGNNLQLIHPSFILKTLFYWNGADFLLKNGSES